MNNLPKLSSQNIDVKTFYMNQLKGSKLEEYIAEFLTSQVVYESALREVSTKLEILNDEFQTLHDYNPIEHIKSRVKSPKSILEKLMRKGHPLTVKSMQENLNDIAGIRVICSFIDDIYSVAEMLTSQDDVTLIKRVDYIKNPKPNGYRSLHLVIEIPVFFSNETKRVKVEVQIRTVAMDFWASLEHKLHYKYEGSEPENITQKLKFCADVISTLDEKMMEINKEILKKD